MRRSILVLLLTSLVALPLLIPVRVGWTASSPDAPNDSYTSQDNAYKYLCETMDKYNDSFDVYTEADAGGNHYIPSGWVGDVQRLTLDPACSTTFHTGSYCTKATYTGASNADNHFIPSGMYNGSSNMTFNEQWMDSPHSGSNCTRVTWSGAGGNDTWKWNGVAWQQPEGNWKTDPSQHGYDLTGATGLTFWARTEEPGLELRFLVGYPNDSSGEVLIDTDGWVQLSTTWSRYEIDLAGRNLSDIACGFACVFNDVHDPDPDGCTFYLDDIRYEYPDSYFNVYSDAQQQWAGIYWQYPENNWGDQPGYDLTGATSLTFWARGERGGERIECKAGGINRPPFHDSTKPYQDSFGPKTTGVFVLSDKWREYTIDLRNEDLSCVIGGFCCVVTGASNPSGCTFYLDDTRYNKSRSDEPRFLLSYEPTSAHDDMAIRNAASIYDNALAMLAFMARGGDEDWTRAKIIGDGFLFCRNNDPYYSDGRLRNAYQAGDIADGLSGKARLPGWWDEQERRWQQDKEQVGSYSGNAAWVMIALLDYHEEKQDPGYLEAAKGLGEWIEQNCSDTRGKGGYTAGYEGWGPTGGTENVPRLGWKSTEHNMTIYVAFTKLFQLTSDALWQNRALHAKGFVEAMWHDGANHFWSGTRDDGITTNEDVIPVAAQCLGLLALDDVGRYINAVAWAETNCLVQQCPKGCGFKGVDYYCDKDGVWFEGTALMSIAYRINNEKDKSDNLLGEICKAQTSASHSNGKGIVAACHDGVTTGFTKGYGPLVYNNRLHVGATAWYIFAEKNRNPLWLFSPTVTEVTPAQGNQGHTCDVTINGSSLKGATAISFGGGIRVNAIAFNTDDQITTNISIDSAATPGARDISVATPRGTVIKKSGFTVSRAPPTITSMSPDEGGQGQTLDVIISGTNFAGATTVSIGDGVKVNTYKVDTPTQMIVSIGVAEDATKGPRDVSVTTPGGTATETDGFTVIQAPSPGITSLSPNQGNRGQTLSVTISGTHFTGATAVSFGSGITVKSFTVESATQITANITVAGDATTGPRDVSVTTLLGIGGNTDGFTVSTVFPTRLRLWIYPVVVIGGLIALAIGVSFGLWLVRRFGGVR